MSSGHVLGIHNGQLIEYDVATLAPLGLVVGIDELVDKKISIVDNPSDDPNDGMLTNTCATLAKYIHQQNQSVILLNKIDGSVSVVQPNENGSYWRRFDRNKNELFASRISQL